MPAGVPIQQIVQDPSDFPSRRPLCFGLYQQLRKVPNYGSVLVANEGEGMTGTKIRDATYGDQWVVSTWGETYRINCPFCGDTRRRLWINYRFGQPDPANPSRMADYFGVCFNEDCLRDYDNRQKLIEWIYGIKSRNEARGFVAPQVHVEDEIIGALQLTPRGWPGDMTSLSAMRLEDPAVQYIINRRRFGWETVEDFGLHVCLSSSEYPAAIGRIVVPITMCGQMFGWQGRIVGDQPNKAIPKYYTCPGMKKQFLLYNLDRVTGQPFVVVFEGVTDVWRLPKYGVALLGKTMSAYQKGLLQTTFQNRQPIIICLDPDAYDNCNMKIHEMIQAGSNPIVRVRLQEGWDPADYDSDVLLATIAAQARSARITLPI